MDINDIINNSFEEQISHKADINKIPIMGTFEISPICNLDCQMCYIAQKKKEVEDHGGLLDISFWINNAKEGIKKGLLFLLITGGEPFLYKNFKELYLKLQNLGIYICINTNGTLIDEDIVYWLKENPPRRLNISLYGSSSETYEKLCKNKNGFKQVINAMNLLKENNIMFRINAVLTPDNINDYQGIIEIAESFNVPLTFSYYMFPHIRKANVTFGYNYHRLTPEEAGRIGYIYNKDKRTDSEFNEYLEKVQNLLKNPEENFLYGCDSIHCRAGSSSFWVNWKGEMSPCGVMDTPKIDLKTTPFDKAWEYIREETDKIRLPKKCSTCNKREYCYICAAASYSETGSFDKAPEYLCQLTEEYVSRLTEEYNRRKKCEND